jgi:hypothetical protein
MGVLEGNLVKEILFATAVILRTLPIRDGRNVLERVFVLGMGFVNVLFFGVVWTPLFPMTLCDNLPLIRGDTEAM